ncbi:hypothetical protein MRB53_035828 [Persea americana]|uniref:Uncharacterized protein n=1 Tax=Persea americana TaxID=3435 RepID=A0ACC2K5R8_PERAE|nr:hypothetical protein MRB53_035828 [Persea americana]
MASSNTDDTQGARDEKDWSPEEITHHRQMAQHNSLEAIKAAEERYEKAKQSGSAALKETKEAATYGAGAAATNVTAKATEAEDSAIHGARNAAGYVSEKGAAAKDYTAEKGVQGYQGIKDSAASAVQTAAEKTKQPAVQAKYHLTQKAQEAKEVTVSTGQTAVSYATQKEVEAKDMTASAAQKAMEIARQKAAETKDTTVEATESALGYASQKAEESEDKTVEILPRVPWVMQARKQVKPTTRLQRVVEEPRSTLPRKQRRRRRRSRVLVRGPERRQKKQRMWLQREPQKPSASCKNRSNSRSFELGSQCTVSMNEPPKTLRMTVEEQSNREGSSNREDGRWEREPKQLRKQYRLTGAKLRRMVTYLEQ